MGKRFKKLTLFKVLNQMVKSNIKFCFMEVSSHGIHQKRITGLEFKGAIFTNLTHDHLDYHDTFKAYRDTKKILFDGLSDSAFALVNADDKNAKVMVQNCKAKIHSYPTSNPLVPGRTMDACGHGNLHPSP